jgi:RNA polymerase sigma-70 factor, ECF subfamily
LQCSIASSELLRHDEAGVLSGNDPVDRATFEHLALENFDAVYRMAMQLCRHPDEASELVQETYLRALRATDRFESRGGGMRAWLFKILHNVFFNRADKERNQPAASEEILDAVADEPGPDAPWPAWDLSTLNWDHVDERLKTAINRLKPDYRTALLLWAVEGLKYREIAEVVGVPAGTVMSRLHRARSLLMQDLQEMAEEMRLRSG